MFVFFPRYFPMCAEIMCSAIAPVINAVSVLDGSSDDCLDDAEKSVATACTVTCEPGYQPTEETTTCRLNTPPTPATTASWDKTLGCAECTKAGVESKAIPDSRLFASGTHSDCGNKDNWRLNGVSAWCPRQSSTVQNPYVEVVFLESTEVSGVITQGMGDNDEWVTRYKIGYIEDACSPTLKFFEEAGETKIFNGNVDRNTEVKHTFTTHINAASVRIYPTAASGATALRFEFMTCSKSNPKTCTKAGVEDSSILAANLIASGSSNDCNDKDRWRLNAVGVASSTGDGFAGSWCAADSNFDGHYVGVKFDQATEVSGLVTQGRQDSDHWVSEFKVGYTTTDGGTEDFILDDSGNPKLFTANNDRDTEVEQHFPCHLNVFSVRIHPTICNEFPYSLRFEVITCT